MAFLIRAPAVSARAVPQRLERLQPESAPAYCAFFKENRSGW
ncbi:hypothetical protein GPEL0_01r3679 [Geoanaerobacter pelophilus]|uniref:Uncharacterized protein n=1 Tax=Geoanaerobacter pelophilus TaxID=60036 RepID=A0ABQ0MKV4_9BACT|nr:hypothetical protein GPEL0_01r3679 [Geoanaerobacter pelophilus]